MSKTALFVVLAACGHGGAAAVTSEPDATLGSGSGSASSCKVTETDGDAPACTSHAPANSFDPVIQWTWNGGTSAESNSYVIALVANLTDDNGDGAIDLCDTPDVVVVSTAMNNGFPMTPGHIHILAGTDGTEELMIPTTVDATVTPAIGDLDGDGVPEIVAVDPSGSLWAFHHDGTPLFGPSTMKWGFAYSGAIALADLDHDGHVEILAGTSVYDDRGNLKWKATDAQSDYPNTIAADLDGDGYMEVITGPNAYRWNGAPFWKTGLANGFAQVANFDADPTTPEVLLTNANGFSLIRHDGTIIFQNLRPTGVPAGANAWLRPAVVGDFNGDGVTDFAMSSGPQYDMYSQTGVSEWNATVNDPSGVAAGTAFDFLGDGHTEAMYADETMLWVFDDHGNVLFKLPRSSETLIEYPIVADIDNDGSAEIVVTSNVEGPASPTVQVIRDRQDRWIQARRIWNQHSYHVTNVREDGTIPKVEPDSWKQLNTYRANAQISSSGVCVPTLL